MTKPTRLLTDASRKHGLGFIMQQQHGDDWKLVQAGSRYINETEAGYSMLELELLTVVWAMQKDVQECPINVRRIFLEILALSFFSVLSRI